MWSNQPEQFTGAFRGTLRCAAYQLRKLLQFSQRLALNDSLRAVGQIDVAAACLFELPGEAVGDAREDGAPQHQELPGPDALQQLVHRTVKLANGRIEVFVDGCANGDNEGCGVLQNALIRRGSQESRSECFSENLVGMKMAEVLEGVDTVLVPSGGKAGMNPLDLNQVLRLFDVAAEAAVKP